ncbi:MAG: preprotein translocase subunit YajC [Gammaproteobacteria bacterium RIFCSPHIGHO2_12_FULL_35_23]|nr:MAG: preprotein translocase subunit YajC [Gammaproteobacteria bacterium RIFCSPHIGHO2_12_FULL_35_23]
MSFISTAYAADAVTTVAPAAQPHSPSMTPMIVILAVIILFYFWLWRSQSKKTKSRQTVIDGLTKGDEIITTGGVAGLVKGVEEGYITLQVATETDILVQKSAVAAILPKGTIKHLEK